MNLIRIFVLTVFILVLVSFGMLSSCGPKVTHKIDADPIKIDFPPEFTIYQSVAFERMYKELVAICLDLYADNDTKLKKCKEDASDAVYDAINEANREKDF